MLFGWFFQAVAWYTPLYCNKRQGWVVKEENTI